MIKFKKAMVRDLPAIWKLELYGYEYPLDHAKLEEMLMGSGNAPIIGELGNMTVLWCVFNRSGSDLLLNRLTTHPSMRRKGFARSCLDYVVKAVKKDGPGKIMAVVPEYQMEHNDPDSINDFAWKTGFIATGVIPKVFYNYGRDYDGVRLEKLF